MPGGIFVAGRCALFFGVLRSFFLSQQQLVVCPPKEHICVDTRYYICYHICMGWIQ